MVGIPIGLFTLAMVWWALHQGYLKESLDSKALGQEIKSMSRKNKKSREKDDSYQHPVQKKWAKFGGGFYGIVAFFTYIVIEVLDIMTTITDFGGFIDFLRQLDIGVIVGIFIEALTNFISAMVWPLYWMDRIETHQVWIWFAVAYGGYWLGLKQAQALFRRRKETAT